MPKNRDYTGLLRTPPSMAWLIRERGALKGAIDRRRKQLESLPAEIAALEESLKALDHVIPMHEVKVDPQEIVGVRQKSPPIAAYGTLTRAIYRTLREADGKPVYTTAIAYNFITDAGIDLTKTRRGYVVDRVSRRLKEMTRNGLLQRHHDPEDRKCVEGLWSLALDAEDFEDAVEER